MNPAPPVTTNRLVIEILCNEIGLREVAERAVWRSFQRPVCSVPVDG
jgi:hypothetical protein